MKVPAAFILCLAIVAQAGKSLPDNQPTILICMDSGPGVGFALTRAQSIASNMFSTIGVRLEWHHGSHSCKLPVERTIHISIVTGEPKENFPDALAVAWLNDETHRIKVFYDRVLEIGEPTLVPSLLAHVLVHEITHVIEGLNRHSENGVMKARWDEADFHSMAWEPLGFAPEDIMLLHARIGTAAMAQSWFSHGRSVSGLPSGAGTAAFAPPAASASSKASIVP